MLKKILGAVWRVLPRMITVRGVRLAQAKFTVSAGAVVTDEQGRVLLVKHVFRKGSGWGVPGGFIAKGEQPDSALRRELREEIGLEIEGVELAVVRTIRTAGQVEITYRCRAASEPSPRSVEVVSVKWFALDNLPNDLSKSQRQLIEQVTGDKF